MRRLSWCLPLYAALFRSAVPSKDWHAKVDGGGAVGAPVELGELVVGAGEADLEALDLAEPASRSASAMRASRLSSDLPGARVAQGLAAGVNICHTRL
jgi:hypothetical protein